MKYHIPVLLNETTESLDIKNGGMYIDCTLGGGGHFKHILSQLTHGIVIGIDVDKDAIKNNMQDLLQLGFEKVSDNEGYVLFKKNDLYALLVNDNFKNIKTVLERSKSLLHIDKNADGVLFDLGVSSYQIDEAAKGFSYMKSSPLDMRMDDTLQVKAEDLVNGMYEKELESVLRTYGEEVFARQIARAIIKARKGTKITDSKQLTEIIKKSVPFYYKNPYAKTFQALRIAVNGEMDSLQEAVEQIYDVLAEGGKVSFISFHSLEDRIIKTKFKNDSRFEVMQKMLKPEIEEVDVNKRARSAKLRCYKKI